jgi:hypothetical protein
MNTPVRIGDVFQMENGTTWKVIETKPGGKIELFCSEQTRFLNCYHREVKTWERVTK